MATPPRKPRQAAAPAPAKRARPATTKAATPKAPAGRPGPAWLYTDNPCAHFEPFQRPTCRAMLD